MSDDCKHEWVHTCKVPGQGLCYWCDKCKYCGVKPIETFK